MYRHGIIRFVLCDCHSQKCTKRLGKEKPVAIRSDERWWGLSKAAAMGGDDYLGPVPRKK